MKGFSGIQITSGIDAHLKQWNVCIYVGKRLHKTFQQPPCSEVLHNYLTAHFPHGNYVSAYEAGYFGFNAHRELLKLGIANQVINAADIPTSDKDRQRKSDKIDAKKIAQCLLKDAEDIPSIFVPNQEQEADRQLVRYRTNVVRKEMTRAKQRLKAFLVFKAKHKEIVGYSSSYWSKKVTDQIKELKFDHPSDQFVLAQFLEDLNNAKQRFTKVNRQIVLLSKEPQYAKLVKRLRTVPGIGLLSAMVIITEVIQMDRFESLDKLCSFSGIVPDVKGSDSKEIVKGLTYRANKELRRILVQSGWVASARDATFAKVYHKQLTYNGIKQKAIIRVCRKLLSVIRAIWIKQEDYIPNFEG